MKKIFATLSVIILLISALIYFTAKDERQKYEDKINSHEFSNRGFMSKTDLKKIPKYDRPDLAWEQDFLKTMDPKLGRPARERLLPIYDDVFKFRRAKSGIPGDINNSWVERGPNNVGGRVRALMFDPNDSQHKKVWAGSVSGGLWYTNDITNENATWNHVTNQWQNLAISTIAYDPKNTQIYYAGTGEGWSNFDAVRGLGIWKTTDAGKTWKHLKNTTGSNFKTIQKIVVSKSGRVLAGTNSGLYISDNHGNKWNKTLNSFVSDIEISSDGTIYAGVGNRRVREGGVFKSTDNGNTWTNITPKNNETNRVELAVSASNPQTIYAVAAGKEAVSWFKKSKNGGAIWFDVKIPRYLEGCNDFSSKDFTREQQDYNLILAVHPSNPEIIIAGGIDLLKSADGGNTWNSISNWSNRCRPYVHADQHAIVFRPEHENEAVFGNDGGIAFSKNVGNSDYPEFIIRNKNFSVTQFYSCAIHPEENKNYYLGGTQDNGSQLLNNKGIGNGIEVTGGDGGFCFIDEKMPNFQITSYINNIFYYSKDGGRTFGTLQSSETGSFINPSAYDHNLGILYSTYDDTLINRVKNIREAPKISKLRVPNLGTLVSSISVSPYTTKSTTLYIGTYAGNLFKVVNANTDKAKFDKIGTNKFPLGAISCVAFGESEKEILVTFSNYGVKSVWYSNDGGKNWQDKEGNLPDMPVRWALFNPENRKEVLLATEVGVWATKNFDAEEPTWQPSNLGLANVRVDMLRLRKSDNQVVAATHGRGLFTSDAFSKIDKSKLRAVFSAIGNRMIYLGENVEFENLSNGDADSCLWKFEGGIPSISREEKPIVKYTKKGKYKVSLTVYKNKKKHTKTSDAYIEVEGTSGWVTQNAVAYTQAAHITDYIDIVNHDVVWALVEVDGEKMMQFIKTLNGGKTWKPDTFDISGNLDIAMICALSKDIAWVPVFPKGEDRKGCGIYKTIDGGATWKRQKTAVFKGEKAFPNVVYFWDKNTGFCMGDPNDGYFEIYTTTDGGANWKRVEKTKIPDILFDDEYGTVGYFCVAADETVFFNTTKGRIFKSTDKGNTWTVIKTPLSGRNKCAFADENNGVLIELMDNSMANARAYTTSDGGKSWKQVKGNNFYNSHIRYVPGSQRMYVTTGSNIKSGVAFSVDGGETWTKSEKQTGSPSFNIDFLDITTGWVGKHSNRPTKGGIDKYAGVQTIPDFKFKITSRENKEVLFTDITLSVDKSLNYKWDFGEDATPKTATTGGEHTVKYSKEGLKRITLIVNGVFVTKELAISATSIGNIAKKEDLVKVYPNPSDDEITVHFISDQLATDRYIYVYKSNGQLVYSQKMEEGNQKTIALAKYGKGIYLVKVSNGKNFDVRKVVIN